MTFFLNLKLPDNGEKTQQKWGTYSLNLACCGKLYYYDDYSETKGNEVNDTKRLRAVKKNVIIWKKHEILECQWPKFS